MPAILSEILSQMKGIWARLDVGQRLTIGAVLIATLAGLGGLVWFARLPDWQIVRSSADARELSQATRALEQGGVAYKIEGSGILVESADVADARRVLASAGIAGGSGFELGDLGSLTSDRATRMHVLARLVEHDAERKLGEMQGVLHAQVSHSKPKRSPFREQDGETQPRANVGLRIERGASFRAVAAAARVEAAAALGIPPEYVTVTNLVTGQTDSGDEHEASALDAHEFIAQQRRRSDDLTARAQSLLDLVYPGKAVVRVTVTLDPEWTITKERGSPDKPLVVHSKTTREDSKDPGAVASGDPSAASAPGGVVGTALGASASQPTHKKETKETDYATDAFKETTSGRLAPDVRNMTVAVVADRAIVPDEPASTAFKQMIKNAIGWPQQFSDDNFTLHVAEIPELVEESESMLTGVMPLIERHGPAAAQLAAVLLVVLFLIRLLRKGALPRAPVAPEAEAPHSTEPSASLDDERRRMRKEIERAIAEDPAAMSRLLESWLMEHKA